MEQANSSPIEEQKHLAPPQSTSLLRRLVLRVCVVILALIMVLALTLFRIYGVDTHHASRGSTLRRDLLDHYATYTVSEKDLNAFLDKRFARPGEKLDSFSERSPAKPETVGKAIGPLGWVVTKDTVVYTYYASNGGGHTYVHDTNTGRTYQRSVYW